MLNPNVWKHKAGHISGVANADLKCRLRLRMEPAKKEVTPNKVKKEVMDSALQILAEGESGEGVV